MARKIVTEVTTGTAARILYLSPEAVNQLCEEGTLRARRTGHAGWWRIDLGSIYKYKFKRPPTPEAPKAK